MSYEDNVLIRLKRQYSKDEALAAIIKKQKELEKENGILTSERDELNDKLTKVLSWDNDTKSRYCQLRYIQNIRKQLKSLKEQVRKLNIENERLIHKLALANDNNNR